MLTGCKNLIFLLLCKYQTANIDENITNQQQIIDFQQINTNTVQNLNQISTIQIFTLKNKYSKDISNYLIDVNKVQYKYGTATA